MFLLNKLWGYLVGLGAIALGLLGLFSYAKRQGKKGEQAVETERSLQQAKGANAIDDKVHSMSDAQLDEQLRSVRPPAPK